MKVSGPSTVRTFVLGATLSVFAASNPLAAEIVGIGSQSGIDVKQVVASQLAAPMGAGFKWGDSSNRKPVLSDQAGQVNTADKWATISTQVRDSVAQTSSAASSVKGFRWGIRSTADQQGFRWGIRSTADQQGFRWGIRSTADQQGFRWDIR